MTKHSEFFYGTCQLFNPEGGIEGALVKSKLNVVQVSVPPNKGLALIQVTGPRQQLRALGVPNRALKTR